MKWHYYATEIDKDEFSGCNAAGIKATYPSSSARQAITQAH